MEPGKHKAGSPMETALKLLSRRPYTVQKLFQKLSSVYSDQEEVTSCLERLKGWGYLNDREYGIDRIKVLQEKFRSRAFVQGDLIENGIPLNLVIELLAFYYPEGLEIDIARKLLLKKRGKTQKSISYELGLLTRAGFSENTILQCFPEVSFT